MQERTYKLVTFAGQHLLPYYELALRGAHTGCTHHIVHRGADGLFRFLADDRTAYFAQKGHDIGLDYLAVGVFGVQVHRQIVAVLNVRHVLVQG